MHPEDAAAAALVAILPTLPAWSPGAGPAQDPAPSSAAGMPADQCLREFFHRHPALGKRDRLQIGNRVFDVLRNLRLYEELVHRSRGGAPAKPAPGRPQDYARELIDLARAAAAQPAAGATDEAGATSETGEPRVWSLAQAAAGLPDAVRYSLPDWLWQRLQASHGERAGAIAQALLQPSPIDLRTNLLVGKPAALRQKLAARGIDAVPIDGVPTGLRVTGRPNLEKLDLFEQGWFEIQDAGSQRIADFCQARRGQLVVDFCAGAGGKTLAIAARMRNMGKVLAFDTGEQRLSRLMPRARRAGTDIVSAIRMDGLADPRLARYRRRADVVLVDAPCSGTGTLRRSPDLKWRLTPQRLSLHVQEQQAILAAASALVKPGGRLVYATCSLLQEENEQQVERFDASVAGGAAGFRLIQVDSWLPDMGPSSGFFVAKWLFEAPVPPPAGTMQ
jgi:16S rRNA (cytosine967-C5)-methyltransferase